MHRKNAFELFCNRFCAPRLPCNLVEVCQSCWRGLRISHKEHLGVSILGPGLGGALGVDALVPQCVHRRPHEVVHDVVQAVLAVVRYLEQCLNIKSIMSSSTVWYKNISEGHRVLARFKPVLLALAGLQSTNYLIDSTERYLGRGKMVVGVLAIVTNSGT